MSKKNWSTKTNDRWQKKRAWNLAYLPDSRTPDVVAKLLTHIDYLDNVLKKHGNRIERVGRIEYG
jgi:hypothetical protein